MEVVCVGVWGRRGCVEEACVCVEGVCGGTVLGCGYKSVLVFTW